LPGKINTQLSLHSGCNGSVESGDIGNAEMKMKIHEESMVTQINHRKVIFSNRNDATDQYKPTAFSELQHIMTKRAHHSSSG
jgi:predicted Zn-dependent protease